MIAKENRAAIQYFGQVVSGRLLSPGRDPRTVLSNLGSFEDHSYANLYSSKIINAEEGSPIIADC